MCVYCGVGGFWIDDGDVDFVDFGGFLCVVIE